MRGGRSGRGTTLYARGEAVAVSYSSSAGNRSVYLGKDLLGSVRTATTEGGLLEERYEYDAFGTPYQGDLSGGMNLGYTGKPYDPATGLYNYGYRDYQSAAARFTSEDPIRDGNNWFAYVNNDPVNYVDLWGLIDWALVSKGLKNAAEGALKTGGGVAIITISVGGTAASSGSLSVLGGLGVLAGGGLVTNGWIQASIGVAEIVGGLISEPKKSSVEIPSTLNQMAGIVADNIKSDITGEPSTIFEDIAKVVDTIQAEIAASAVLSPGLGVALSLATSNAKLNDYESKDKKEESSCSF